VLDSPKPKLFIQARRPRRNAAPRGLVGSGGILPARSLRGAAGRAQGSRDEFTAPSKLLEVRARVPVVEGPLPPSSSCSAGTRRFSHTADFASAQWAVPQSKSAVTETRIIADMGHFQARPCRGV
jgi:hypothetical protein